MLQIIRFIYIVCLAIYYRIWQAFINPCAASSARFKRFLIALGPIFIKFGQVLSTRPDIVGSILADELSSLQDNMKRFPYKMVTKIFLKEFASTIENMFSAFEKIPVASASIAQVHFAVTKNGDEVAVKILRPAIEKKISRDLKIMFWAAKLLKLLSKKIDRFKPIEVVKFFKDTIIAELDFRMEAAAADQLRENLANDEFVIIPKIYWDLSCKSIMTMERIKGIKISDHKTIAEKGLDRKIIAKNLAVTFFNMTYRDGFFHADLHPGNIFVDESYNIILVDFGIIGIVDDTTRIFVAETLRGFLNNDYKRISELHFEAGYIKKDKSPARFALACRSIGAPIVGKGSKQIAVGRLLSQLIDITRYFEMETQIELLLLQKNLILIEGVGTLIDKEINLWELAKPWIENWAVINISPEAKLVSFAKTIPEKLRKILSS